MSERKAGNRELIEGRELHDVIIPIGERGLTSFVVTISRDVEVRQDGVIIS
jgi:hypothetical protein